MVGCPLFVLLRHRREVEDICRIWSFFLGGWKEGNRPIFKRGEIDRISLLLWFYSVSYGRVVRSGEDWLLRLESILWISFYGPHSMDPILWIF